MTKQVVLLIIIVGPVFLIAKDCERKQVCHKFVYRNRTKEEMITCGRVGRLVTQCNNKILVCEDEK